MPSAQLADAHGLAVVEDSCDALGSTLRGTPTGTRSDISVTSFALSHIITAAGTGGMVCLDDDDWSTGACCCAAGAAGRRFSSSGRPKGAGNRFFSSIDDGLEYDNLFIFDEVGWNFEPSELSAAFGLVQLDKLPTNLATRKRNFARLTRVLLAATRRVRSAPDDAGRRHGVAHVSGADPAGVGDSALRVPTAHGTQRNRHANGLDRQRHAPAGVRQGQLPRSLRADCPTRTGSWNRASSCPRTMALTTMTSTTSGTTAEAFCHE